MSKYLLLKGFNSYLNRVIKRYDTLEEYIAVVGDQYAIRPNMNFNPNDGVNASAVYNYRENEIIEPDYFIVADDNDNIIGRYFVTENKRTRNGQYITSLRRDLVADYYNAVLSAPTFIEKATLDKDNPLIFNSENMTYNQIKNEDEILLKDETKTPWIVGYYATPQYTISDGKIEFQESNQTIASVFAHDPYVTTNKTPDQFIVENILGKTYSIATEDNRYACNLFDINDFRLAWRVNKYLTNTDYASEFTASFSGETYPSTNISYNQYAYKEKNLLDSTTRRDLKNAIKNHSSIATYFETYIKTVYAFANTTPENVWIYNNKLIKANGTIYQIRIETTSNNLIQTGVNPYTSGTDFANSMSSITSSVFTSSGTSGSTSGRYEVYRSPAKIIVSYAEVNSTTSSWTTIPAKRKILSDAPYCMFAIPYYQFKYKATNGSYAYTDPVISLAMARSIAEQGTSAKCYDLQILPYCPVREFIKSDGTIDLEELHTGDYPDYTIIGDSTAPDSLIFWGTNSQFNFIIRQSLTVPNNNIDFKIESETSKYRLCSPNYSGEFEFNAAKNGGVTYFKVDCCYKPYTPYIHLAPNFGRLYGKNTDDARGLICAGDFSVSRTSDAWSSYEIQNKNYQNIFNRQISNLEVQHQFEMMQKGVGAVTSAGQAAMMGSFVNPALGAAAGVGSLAAGVGDQFLAQDMFNETIDYTQDQFNYQLGNIKAQPDSLTNVSAMNNNNKLFPFLEHYDCTTEEKDALRNKLYYNGMSVGVIGTIGEYLQSEPSYIKGKIIRLSTGEDAHMNAEIQKEIYQGVFI